MTRLEKIILFILAVMVAVPMISTLIRGDLKYEYVIVNKKIASKNGYKCENHMLYSIRAHDPKGYLMVDEDINPVPCVIILMTEKEADEYERNN